VIYADIDLAEVAKVRSRIPSLNNERPFTVERI
jgi:predicted amidohydrolase